MQRLHWAVVAGVIAVALASGVWFGSRGPAPPPPISFTVPSPAGTATIAVHVAGAVARPGVVELSAGARVADAVAAAGGAAAAADLSGVNLAAPVSDGGQVVVPTRSEGAGVSLRAGGGKVRLNSATAAALEALPGVGPVTAERIVAHREQHGPFASVEDLLDVPGIGEGKLAALRDLVEVP